MTETQLPMVQQRGELAVADVMRQHLLIQQVVKEVMIPGHHYGVIPGTEAKRGEKERPPVLLKPGAEKLCMVFRLAASFVERTKDLPNGHREERVTCTLTHIPTGGVVATAMGSCSTMETKYRYRNSKPKCPSCEQESIFKSKQGKQEWFCWEKKGGCGATFPLHDKAITEQKIGLSENKDLADTFNTVLKMAVKRALVAATLLATAASDAFIVEEDAPDDGEGGDDERREQPPRQQRGGGSQKVGTKPGGEPQKGGAGTDPKPQALSEKQQLAHDCGKMASELGWDLDTVARTLRENNICNTFERWGALDEATLKRARGMFEAALKAGAPTEGTQ